MLPFTAFRVEVRSEQAEGADTARRARPTHRVEVRSEQAEGADTQAEAEGAPLQGDVTTRRTDVDSDDDFVDVEPGTARDFFNGYLAQPDSGVAISDEPCMTGTMAGSAALALHDMRTSAQNAHGADDVATPSFEALVRRIAEELGPDCWATVYLVLNVSENAAAEKCRRSLTDLVFQILRAKRNSTDYVARTSPLKRMLVVDRAELVREYGERLFRFLGASADLGAGMLPELRRHGTRASVPGHPVPRLQSAYSGDAGHRGGAGHRELGHEGRPGTGGALACRGGRVRQPRKTHPARALRGLRRRGEHRSVTRLRRDQRNPGRVVARAGRPAGRHGVRRGHVPERRAGPHGPAWSGGSSRGSCGSRERILVVPRRRQEPGQERVGALQSGEKSLGLSGALLVAGAGLGFRVGVVLVEEPEAHGTAERGLREDVAGARCSAWGFLMATYCFHLFPAGKVTVSRSKWLLTILIFNGGKILWHERRRDATWAK